MVSVYILSRASKVGSPTNQISVKVFMYGTEDVIELALAIITYTKNFVEKDSLFLLRQGEPGTSHYLGYHTGRKS